MEMGGRRIRPVGDLCVLLCGIKLAQSKHHWHGFGGRCHVRGFDHACVACNELQGIVDAQRDQLPSAANASDQALAASSISSESDETCLALVPVQASAIGLVSDSLFMTRQLMEAVHKLENEERSSIEGKSWKLLEFMARHDVFLILLSVRHCLAKENNSEAGPPRLKNLIRFCR